MSGSPAPEVTPVSEAEGKQLLYEFTRAQSQDLAGLKKRQATEWKDLKAAQKARQADWDRKERDDRHKFFADHPAGPDRRAYIQDYLNRRRIFAQILSDEASQKSRDQSVRLSAVKEDQALKLKEFKEFLSHSQRPPTALWPAGG